MTLPVSIIVAVAENGVIGMDGGMPWRLSSDMKRFKAVTMGNPVIMGRKTFESFPRALPGRHNIVITRNPALVLDDAVVSISLDDALEAAQKWGAENNSREVFILGGGEIYRQSMDLTDRLYVTEVEANPDGDTEFPAIDPNIWQINRQERLPAGSKDSAATRFVVYERS